MSLRVHVQHDTARRAEQERWALAGGTGQLEVHRGSPHTYLMFHPARVITHAQLRVRQPQSLRDALHALGQQAGKRTLGCRR